MEGIGYDFVPRNMDRRVVDEWMKVRDVEGMPMTRRLIAEEGFFCGGTSGAILHCAIKYAKDNNLNENHRIVVLCPDNLRNYLTKLVSTEWMIEKGFYNID